MSVKTFTKKYSMHRTMDRRGESNYQGDTQHKIIYK